MIVIEEHCEEMNELSATLPCGVLSGLAVTLPWCAISGSHCAFRADDCNHLIDALFKSIIGYDVVEFIRIEHLRCLPKTTVEQHLIDNRRGRRFVLPGRRVQDQNANRIGQLALYLCSSTLIDLDQQVVAVILGFLKTIKRRPIVIAENLGVFEKSFSLDHALENLLRRENEGTVLGIPLLSCGVRRRQLRHRAWSRTRSATEDSPSLKVSQTAKTMLIEAPCQ